MPYTSQQIIQLPNPYQALGSSDAFAENRGALNGLTAAEQVAVATKIIFACPKEKLSSFRPQLEALNSPIYGNSFYSVITEAYEVRQSIRGLWDYRNTTPHNLFLGNACNPAIFHRFSELAKKTLDGYESIIAERLALSTPQAERSNLARQITIMFPNSLFAQKIGTAFMLRHNIDTLLLGETPEQFFSSKEFNTETCQEFPKLFASLLKDKEATIGNKLTAINASARVQIRRKLQLLTPTAHDDANPFKLIIDVMPYEPTSVSPIATNPNTLFSTGKGPYSPALDTLNINSDHSDNESAYGGDGSEYDDSDAEELDGNSLFSSRN